MNKAIAGDIRAMRDLAQAVLADADGREPGKLVEGDGPHALAWRDWPEPDTLADAAWLLKRNRSRP